MNKSNSFNDNPIDLKSVWFFFSQLNCNSFKIKLNSIIHNSQDMEATKMSIDRGVDKEDVPIYNRILLSHTKEWNNAICSNMDGPRDYHTKWSKSERERQIPYDITYTWNLKHDTNELIYETETDSQT